MTKLAVWSNLFRATSNLNHVTSIRSCLFTSSRVNIIPALLMKTLKLIFIFSVMADFCYTFHFMVWFFSPILCNCSFSVSCFNTCSKGSTFNKVLLYNKVLPTNYLLNNEQRSNSNAHLIAEIHITHILKWKALGRSNIECFWERISHKRAAVGIRFFSW